MEWSGVGCMLVNSWLPLSGCLLVFVLFLAWVEIMDGVGWNVSMRSGLIAWSSIFGDGTGGRGEGGNCYRLIRDLRTFVAAIAF